MKNERKHGVWWKTLMQSSSSVVCLFFPSLEYLPPLFNLKETVSFQFIYESHGKQTEISLRKFHIKLGATSYSELRFREKMFSCKARKCNSQAGFFRSLNSSKMCSKQLLWARSCRLGLAPMSLSSPSCNLIRQKMGHFMIVENLSYGFRITLLHSGW